MAGRRLTKDGIIQMFCGRARDQSKNRAEVDERMRQLILEALRPPPAPRKKTKVPRGVKRRRVAAKRKRGDVKKGRQRGWSDD